MATFDYSKAQVVTITNNAKEIKAYDPGSLQRAEADKIFEEADGRKYTYLSTNRRIQFYRVNSYIVLEKGDAVKILAETSEEAAYFASLATDEISVVLSDVPADGGEA